jgi:hypothetical protein
MVGLLGILAGGLYGLSQIKAHYDPIWYMRPSSYPAQFFAALDIYFPGDGVAVQVYVGKNLHRSKQGGSGCVCVRGRFHLRFLLAFLRPREKQREQLGGGAIADGETRAKNASGNGPLKRTSTRPGSTKP